MAKINPIVCAFLFVACIQNGQGLSTETLDILKMNIMTVINKGIDALKYQVYNIEMFVSEVKGNIHETQLSIQHNVYAYSEHFIKKLHEHIDNTSEKYYQCKEVLNSFQDVAKKAYNYTAECVNKVGKDSAAHISMVKTTSKEVFESLKSYSHYAENCTSNVHSTIDIANAIACLNLVAAQATSAVTDKVPKVVLELAKVTTWPVTLTKCTGIEVFQTLQDHYSRTMNQLEDCTKLA